MKVGIIFSGYSSQFVGMCKDLYDEFRIIQEYFEEAFNCTGVNLVKLCFASSEQDINKPTNAYISIFLVNCALYALFKELTGVNPDLFAGYGFIGFCSATSVTKGITFPDGLYILKKLASFYEENFDDSNYSIINIENISSQKLKKICNKLSSKLNIAVYNSNNEYLVSGNNREIEKLKKILKKDDIKFYASNSGLGLHSNLMDEIIEQFKIYLEKIDFKNTEKPVISNIDSKYINIGKQIKNNITKQISKPIKWSKVIDKFVDIDIIVEIGPKSLYLDILKEKYPDKKVVSFNKKSNIENLKQVFDIKEVQTIER